MGGPGISRNFVLPQRELPPASALHLEQDEIMKPALFEMPCGRKSGHAAADYDYGDRSVRLAGAKRARPSRRLCPVGYASH